VHHKLQRPEDGVSDKKKVAAKEGSSGDDRQFRGDVSVHVAETPNKIQSTKRPIMKEAKGQEGGGGGEGVEGSPVMDTLKEPIDGAADESSTDSLDSSSSDEQRQSEITPSAKTTLEDIPAATAAKKRRKFGEITAARRPLTKRKTSNDGSVESTDGKRRENDVDSEGEGVATTAPGDGDGGDRDDVGDGDAPNDAVGDFDQESNDFDESDFKAAGGQSGIVLGSRERGGRGRGGGRGGGDADLQYDEDSEEELYDDDLRDDYDGGDYDREEVEDINSDDYNAENGGKVDRQRGRGRRRSSRRKKGLEEKGSFKSQAFVDSDDSFDVDDGLFSGELGNSTSIGFQGLVFFVFVVTLLLTTCLSLRWIYFCLFPASEAATVVEIVQWKLWLSAAQEALHKLKGPTKRVLKEGLKISSKMLSFGTHALVEGLKLLKSGGC